ncbi:MAG: GTP-binding protein [Burkholderiales bacterium]
MTPSAGTAAIPVSVLTGALGAGKTTLLNAMLKGGALENAAIVVNEFGAVGIDHRLIESSTEDVVLLPGGCVCCQVRADLAEALLRLERGVRRGDIPAFARVAVETSGLAEPGPILQLFVESPALRGRFRLESLVTLVDAQLGLAALEEAGTAYRQALLADRLLLGKAELVDPGAVRALEARLDEVNAHAERARVARGTADAAWLAAPRVTPGRPVPAGALRAAHDEAIESFVLSWDAPQPLAAIGDWLHALAGTHGARLLRVKGIVMAAEADSPVAVHAVQHLVSPPEFLGGAASASRVVFITRGLEPGDVLPPWPASVESVARAPAAPALRLR